MRAKTVNEEFGQKDQTRMEDIKTKAGGNPEKEISLATTQAKIIQDAGKARARGEAAEKVFGPNNEISRIFHSRADELGGSKRGVASPGILAPVKAAVEKGQKLERAFKRDFNLPSERVVKPEDQISPSRGFQRGLDPRAALQVGIHHNPEVWDDQWVSSRRGRHSGSPILPLGKVNLMTGSSQYFNVYDTWGNYPTTAELWKELNDGTLKLIFTSGDKPLYKLGNKNIFIHDQNQRRMFNGQMIDYVSLEDLKELIKKYKVPSISGYTYK